MDNSIKLIYINGYKKHDHLILVGFMIDYKK